MCSMLALAIVWRSGHAAPLRPAAGNIGLLNALDQSRPMIAVQFAPFERLARTDVPPRLVIAEFPQTGAPTEASADQPLIQVPHAPAATYVIDVVLRQPGAGRLSVAVDRRFGPAWQWDLARAPGSFSHEFRTPLPMAEIAIDGDAGARAAIAHLTLRAIAPVPAARRVENREPWHTIRYGPNLLCLMDGGRAYAESGGTWVGGGSFLDFVVTPDDPTVPVHLFVRNPAVDNQITIDAGGWRESAAFKPGEERTFDIPVPANRLSVPVRISSARGARPVEFERGSADTRFLGCWIETR
jgi:hypothetical protein